MVGRKILRRGKKRIIKQILTFVLEVELALVARCARADFGHGATRSLSNSEA